MLSCTDIREELKSLYLKGNQDKTYDATKKCHDTLDNLLMTATKYKLENGSSKEIEEIKTLVQEASHALDLRLKVYQIAKMRQLTIYTNCMLAASVVTGFFDMNFGFMDMDKGSVVF